MTAREEIGDALEIEIRIGCGHDRAQPVPRWNWELLSGILRMIDNEPNGRRQ